MYFYNYGDGYEYFKRGKRFWKSYTCGHPTYIEEITRKEFFMAFLLYILYKAKTFDYLEFFATALSIFTFVCAVFLFVILIMLIRFGG